MQGFRALAVRLALIGGTVALSWLGMMVVHEGGHVLAAWITGGTVTRVVLHPLQISRTDVQPNPSPAVVVWAGPVVGVVGPLLLWLATRRQQVSWAYLARFFAGFCCVANGSYLGAGLMVPVGDAKVMLQLGSSRWLLAIFAVITVPVGFRLWHGEGRHFGLGKRPEAVKSRHAWSVCGLLVLLVLAELWWA